MLSISFRICVSIVTGLNASDPNGVPRIISPCSQGTNLALVRSVPSAAGPDGDEYMHFARLSSRPREGAEAPTRDRTSSSGPAVIQVPALASDREGREFASRNEKG